MSGKKQTAQSGMASFLIVMIMMLVITLIVLGFAQVTRRNAREALDRQLSSQAYYAAESGVNVTSSTITNYVRASGFATLSTKTTCPNNYDPTDVNGNGAAIANLGSGVQYTCVLVNPTPGTLLYNPTQRGSTVIPIAANGNLTSLTFTWQVQSGGVDTSCTGGSPQVFPTAAAWTCDFGVVQVDLIANPAANLGNLPGATVSTFLTPLGAHSGALSLPNFNPANHAYVASASGCATGTCKVKISLVPNTANYYARVTTFYRDATNLILSGTTVGGGSATFSGAQAVVDSTGQAQDELKRIQVRVQLNAAADSNTIPTNGLASTADICKRFPILPTGTVDPTNLCQ